MSERLMIVMTILCMLFMGCICVRYEARIKTIENRQTVITEELKELKKQNRITTQDVDFILRLMMRGVEDGAVQLHTKDEN